MTAPITAIVVALDEATHILPCLATLRWAAEILVVVDARSSDGTAGLAAAAGARVLCRAWDGWAGQRNYALTQARQPWAFFVDADERVPLDLAEEIQARLNGAGSTPVNADTPTEAGTPVDADARVGFWVPRQNLILGAWVEHAGWSPDYQLRLFRRDRGRYDPARPVHELVLLDGPAGYLEHRLVHHNYVSWRQFWTKQARYARAEAAAMRDRGARVQPQNFVLQPLREFRRRYWTLQGYRAGRLGFALSAVLAAANFLTYVHLWRLQPARSAGLSAQESVHPHAALRTRHSARGTPPSER